MKRKKKKKKNFGNLILFIFLNIFNTRVHLMSCVKISIPIKFGRIPKNGS